MKRLISVILCVCLLLTGCNFLRRSSSSDTFIDSINQPKTPSIAARPDSSEVPFAYTLTDEDVAGFYTLLAEAEKAALESSDLDYVDEITTRVSDYLDELEDQALIAQVLYYCDQSDDEASQRFLDCNDMLSDANKAYTESTRRIYQSDSAAKQMLFEDWTQEELDILLAYNPEIAELEKRNAQILVEYQALEDMSADDMVPLYLEQVANSNRIAQIYGYDNYYDYAFELVYGRDYDPAQLQQMRGYVQKYLVPLYGDAYSALIDDISAMSLSDQLLFSAFEMNDYDNVQEDYVGQYLERLPQQMRDGMVSAFETGNSYFTDSADAHEGAFTTVIVDKSFCYFGAGYAGCLTVIHELGHYYAGGYMDLDAVSYDLLETHSQGNEWLFMGMLSEFMDEDMYELAVNSKTFEDLGVVLICVLVDEFEQRIYAMEDPQSLTPEDCNRIMEEVCQNYGGVDYISTYITDIQYYWRMVVVESPVYYISYAVSALSAMNLYTMYQQSPEAAIQAYRVLTEQNWEDEGFMAALEAAGLPGAFDESVYQDLTAKYDLQTEFTSEFWEVI